MKYFADLHNAFSARFDFSYSYIWWRWKCWIIRASSLAFINKHTHRRRASGGGNVMAYSRRMLWDVYEHTTINRRKMRTFWFDAQVNNFEIMEMLGFMCNKKQFILLKLLDEPALCSRAITANKLPHFFFFRIISLLSRTIFEYNSIMAEALCCAFCGISFHIYKLHAQCDFVSQIIITTSVACNLKSVKFNTYYKNNEMHNYFLYTENKRQSRRS